MSELTASQSSRRSFITEITAGAAGLIAAGCASSTAKTAPAPAAVSVLDGARIATDRKWDDTWTKRLGKYRAVFDVSELEQKPAAYQIVPIMDNYKQVLDTTDADMGFVLVVRHAAVPMLVEDPMWEKYNIGADLKRQDRTTNAPYRRNPFKEVITSCQARGVIVLGCNTAMMGFGSRIARRANADVKAVREELFANMLPNVTLLPTGLFAVARAQNVGCGYMK